MLMPSVQLKNAVHFFNDWGTGYGATNQNTAKVQRINQRLPKPCYAWLPAHVCDKYKIPRTQAVSDSCPATHGGMVEIYTFVGSHKLFPFQS
jgi:hypothetical protein